MAKATLNLPNGTIVTISGSTGEIQKLLEIYGESDNKLSSATTALLEFQKPTATIPSPTSAKVNLAEIVTLVKTCKEAESIETQILDKRGEVNRVLLPLYIIHEYINNSFGLTTNEIETVTKDLGIRVSRQNSLRAIKNSGSKYVVSDQVRKAGAKLHYKLNRRGVQYFKSVIARTTTDE